MKEKMKTNFASFSLGLSSMIGQVILIRELVIIFYGNELSIGIMLASWLFWTAVGSLIMGRLINRISFKKRFLSYIQLIHSILLPSNLILIRLIKYIIKSQPGEILGVTSILCTSFMSLSIICIISGATFTLLSKIASEETKAPARGVGRVYLLEGLGASLGGIIYSFFMIERFSGLQNSLIASGFELISSMLFSRNTAQMIYLIIILSSYISGWPSHIDRFIRKLQFKPLELVETVDSRYGHIAVTRLNKNYSFYENGLLIFTTNDLLSSEESVHYAMLEHPSPKNVLLIGGGMSGSLTEILKHHIDSIDYVELDPLLIHLATKYTHPIKDNRINFKYLDGRLFVKESYITIDSHRRYDVIILNLPDPYTALLNRFYSLEFFREIKKILSGNGVFSFMLTSSENYINPEHMVYLRCIYRTLKQVFSDVKMLPGDNIIFLASPQDRILTYDTNTLIQRLKERNIRTKFVREYYIPSKLHSLRIAYIENMVAQTASHHINQDFRPIGYFYHMLLWLTVFHPNKNILSYLGALKINIYIFIIFIISTIIILFLLRRLIKRADKVPVILSIGSTGMSEICFQLIVILTFQSLYGYIYYRVGIILSSFMIGLTIGSLFIYSIVERIRYHYPIYIKTQFFISIYPLVLALICIVLAKINETRPEIGLNLQLAFAFLPIIAGFLGGFQFPLATKICLGEGGDTGKIAGLLYGIDLFGSCIGGLIAGVFLIPIFGILGTSLILWFINFYILLMLKIRSMP